MGYLYPLRFILDICIINITLHSSILLKHESFACQCKTLSTFPSSLSAFPSAVTSRSPPPGMMLACGGRVCPSGCGQYILRQSPEQSCYTRSSRDYPAPLLGATKTASRAERALTSLILCVPIFYFSSY